MLILKVIFLYIGIDVGGTYTDAVLVRYGTLLKKSKTPTKHDNLLESLLTCLDSMIDGENVNEIERVVISTTLITNIIAENKYPSVELILIPGPGLNYENYDFAGISNFIKGAIDYRGREITPIDNDEVQSVAEKIQNSGICRIAVIGKFSNRNNVHEVNVKNILEKQIENVQVTTGHTVSGKLNFPRRVATTMLTAATKSIFSDFVSNMEKVLQKRGIKAPVFILKADGGTLPLSSAVNMPVETIMSGPAASTLGAKALSPKGETSVVVDIGGTTTDLSLVLSGKPLISSKGAVINGFLTDVKSFAVRSVPIGGDSTIVVKNNEIRILPERKGPAFCLGGPLPTPTDALCFLRKIEFGDYDKAAQIMTTLSHECEKTPEETASEIYFKVCQTIANEIKQMFMEWEQEPAYRVWEVLSENKIKPNNIVGVGGAAPGIIPEVANVLNCISIIPNHSEVANAIGAAVALPTVTANVRIDTERGYYTVQESGITGAVENRKLARNQAIELALKCLKDLAKSLKIEDYVSETEVSHCEIYNVVRDWETTGKIFDICVQTPRDILFFISNDLEGLKSEQH